MSTHTGDEGRARPRIGPHRHVGGAALVLVMAAGSVVMWLVSPVAWLWVASRMTSSSQPSLGPYLLVIAGMVATAFVLGKFLGAVNRAHMRVTGRLGTREQAAWMKSMRGERRGVHGDRGVLEQVMAISVAVALVLFAVWFFAFAGSSLPT